MLRSFLIVIIAICGYFIPTNTCAQPVTSLLAAIRDNNRIAVDFLLTNPDNIKSVDADGDNVLMYAALYAPLDYMELLLQKGANPNTTNKLGETALMWCVHDMQKTKLLLDHQADVNARTKAGNTPLLIACVGEQQADMIRLLLQHGADANIKNEKGATALMRTVLFGDTAIARLLINKGVDINEKTKESETALMMAVKTVNKPMVYWLLDNGADAAILDSYKASALAYAVVVNDPSMVRALLKKTKDIDLADIDGMTFLMWATYNEHDNPEIIQAVLDSGASLNLKDKNGETALAWAKKKGNTATVRLLTKAGAK